MELKRTKKITSSVTIEGHVIPVKIDIGKQGNDFDVRYARTVNAEIALKKAAKSKDSNPAALKDLEQAYGGAMTSLIALIFGEDGAEELDHIFEGDYIEMLETLVPFFLEELFPELQEKRRARAELYHRVAGVKGRRFR